MHVVFACSPSKHAISHKWSEQICSASTVLDNRLLSQSGKLGNWKTAGVRFTSVNLATNCTVTDVLTVSITKVAWIIGKS